MEKWGQTGCNPSGYKYKGENTNPFFSYEESIGVLDIIAGKVSQFESGTFVWNNANSEEY